MPHYEFRRSVRRSAHFARGLQRWLSFYLLVFALGVPAAWAEPEVVEPEVDSDEDSAVEVIEAYIENVMGKDVRSTRAIGSSLLGRPVTAAYDPPRTWGVRVGGAF